MKVTPIREDMEPRLSSITKKNFKGGTGTTTRHKIFDLQSVWLARHAGVMVAQNRWE